MAYKILPALALACVAFTGHMFTNSTPIGQSTERAGYMPIEISHIQGTIAAGNQVTYRVILEGAPTEDQEVDISTSKVSAYSSIPNTVVVPANTDRVSFNATLANPLPVSWTVYAEAEGGSVQLSQSSSNPAIGTRSASLSTRK